MSTTNYVIAVVFSIEYPFECRSPYCKQKFREKVQYRISKFKDRTALSFKLINGEMLNGDVILCSVMPFQSGMFIIRK